MGGCIILYWVNSHITGVWPRWMDKPDLYCFIPLVNLIGFGYLLVSFPIDYIWPPKYSDLYQKRHKK